MNSKYLFLIIFIISLKIGQIESTRINQILLAGRNLNRNAFNAERILAAKQSLTVDNNNKVEQISHLSSTSKLADYSRPSFGQKLVNGNLLFARTKTSPLPSLSTQIAKFSTAHSMPKLPMEYTEKDVERYYLRNNLKTEMDALKKMNDENEYKKFRDIFGTINEIKMWDLEDKYGPPPNDHEANIWCNLKQIEWTEEKLKEHLEKVARFDEERPKRLSRWAMEVEINEPKLQQIRENRKEIFKKANEFAFEQFYKLDELYWSEKSRIKLGEFPMPDDKHLDQILSKFMQQYLTLDENTKLFDDSFYEKCFQKNDDAERKIDLTFCHEYLREREGKVDAKMSLFHKELQSLLIKQEFHFNVMSKIKRKEAIQATLIDLESFKLHFEMAELALNAAILAQDARIDESNLEELAKMKFHAKKLRIQQLIMENFAHGGLLAFGYKENEKEENKNLTAKFGDEEAQKKALREIHAQMEIMGFKNKLDSNWTLKMEKGNIEEIEKFIGREILTKSEAKMLGYIAQIYLLIDPKLTEEEFE